MSGSGGFVMKWKAFREKVDPVTDKIQKIIGIIVQILFRLRKVAMAAPVVYFAVRFAKENLERLPELVGLNLQKTGEFAVMVSRNYAVYGPLALTAFCLLLMFCSKKTVFPWVVSVFTLVVPHLIYFTNLFGNI